MPSRPVAFFEFVLFICFDTKSFSISWNINLGISFLFSFIILILGCSSADQLLSLPISFAAFMKKLLKLFATWSWSFMILLLSSKIISLVILLPLLDKNGLIVG
jgi:hypothetical protein